MRVMACFAVLPQNTAARSAELSEQSGVPPHYLSKVLRKLVKAEILSATKGHGGGFMLARPPSKVRLIDIIEAVETKTPTKQCIFGWRVCDSRNPCVLHHRWSAVSEAFQEWIRKTTIEQIKHDATENGWLAPPPMVSASNDRTPTRKLSDDRTRGRSARTSKKSRKR